MLQLKRGQFYVVPKFVVDGLSLESGPMRDIYAIIYNVTQDGSTACACTVRYFMEWTMASERSVRTILGELLKAGYIFRTQVGSGRGSVIEYRANLEIVAQIEKGAKFAPIKRVQNLQKRVQNSAEKGAKFAPNDNNNIIIYNNYSLRAYTSRKASEEEKKEYFRLFFFKNAAMPQAEADGFWRVAELADWKDTKGRALDTFRKRVIWADGWEFKNGSERVNPYFLNTWREIHNVLLREGSPMADRLLDTRIHVDADKKSVLLYCPDDIITWFEEEVVPQGEASRVYCLLKAYLQGRHLTWQTFVL